MEKFFYKVVNIDGKTAVCALTREVSADALQRVLKCAYCSRISSDAYANFKGGRQ